VRFVQSETELTTAATDAALGVLCTVLAIQMVTMPAQLEFKRSLWTGVLALLAVGSFLGAIVHGFALGDASRARIWKPLYLSLGLAVALVAVAAAHDGWGESAARGLLPYALGASTLFFVITQRLGGAFILFVAYEGAAILLALTVYTMLAVRGGMPGAGAMAAGVAVSLAAAAVQVSTLSLTLVVRFDHNGLFHLIQMAGVALMVTGVRASLAP
jgi:hypothetical protein